MKLTSQRLAEFQEAIAAAASGLTDVDVFPGSTLYSPRSIVVCRFQGGDEVILNAAASEAGRLVGERLGVEMAAGVLADGPGGMACWVEYFPGAQYANALLTLQALQAAFAGLLAARSGDNTAQNKAQREKDRLARFPVREIFVQSRFLITAARTADIPVHNIAGSSVGWQFGWGSRSDLFFMTASLADAVPGHQLTWRKNLAKKLFRELGIPTPEWRVLTREADALVAAAELGWPCVVKPIDQAFGTGVTANIRTLNELSGAVAAARKYSRNVLIEAHEPGADHRLMVVDGRLVSAVRREPPSIKGDGKATIGELIDRLNKGRDGSREHGYLLPVERDAALSSTLANRSLTVASVLPDGEALVLRSIANFSTGGMAVDVTADVHPQVRGLAELLAASLSLRTAGIDYITPDIRRSHAEVGGGFIEVNAMPRLRLLMADGQGEADIASLVLGERPGRISVTMIVGKAGDVDKLWESVRARAASREGAAAVTATSVQVGATELPAPGLDAFGMVTAAIRHLAVDELMILWSAEEVRRFGLPADRFHRIVVIDGELDDLWLAAYCPDIRAVQGVKAALAVAFD